MTECRHYDSLYGRCIDCGMTWAQQAEQHKIADAGGSAHTPNAPRPRRLPPWLRWFTPVFRAAVTEPHQIGEAVMNGFTITDADTGEWLAGPSPQEQNR